MRDWFETLWLWCAAAVLGLMIGGILRANPDCGRDLRDPAPLMMPECGEEFPVYYWMPDLNDGGYTLWWISSCGNEHCAGYCVPTWNGGVQWGNGESQPKMVAPPPIFPCTKNLPRRMDQ